MRTLVIAVAAALVVGISALGSKAVARDLTFEDRVKAQEAIERVYYSHQIGATKPFEEAVPRAVIEQKVTKYLKESVALETLWHTPVTAEMLRRELSRIAGSTHLPDRLNELYGALNNDPDLIAECVARPVLTERLSRNFTHEGFEPAGVPLAPSPACSGDDSWNNGNLLALDFNPARQGHTSVWTGSVMIVWGGGGLDSGMRYDPLVDTWSPIATQGAPSGRLYHSAVWTGSRMIVWGGALGGAFQNTGGIYDPVSDSWTATTTTGAPLPRQSAAAVWTGTEMIVWGGYDGTAPALTTGGRYNPATDSWASTSNTGAPVAGLAGVAVWTGQVMVIWGGRTLQGGQVDSGGRYNPSTDTWSSVSVAGSPSIRDEATAVWTGTRMVVWGGDPSSSTGGRYDPVTDTWSPTSVAGAPAGRDQASSVWTGTEMIVWGGLAGPPIDISGGRYNPTSDSWLPTSASGAPSGRIGHTAVWTGSRMIVWGGKTDGTGGRYDPATDSWTPTFVPAPASSITKRSGHTAVWTGTAMIVWGGTERPTDQVTNSGGRYDPALDSWTPTQTLNAPAPRRSHTAVWTGQEMLVWGGLVDAAGGRYDPLTDTWSPISRASEPSTRASHTAVWTGSRMIVWGGKNKEFPSVPDPTCNQIQSADGGSYDPVTDTWTQVTSSGSPGRRSSHSAVWTGSQMIVWGGEYFIYSMFPSPICFLNRDNFGGRYEPGTDSWTPVTTASAPTKKVAHTAVWTGERMIVWGSDPSLGTEILGGRYDPATNAWSPVAELDAPSRRIGSAGVWTGTEMIVWGGSWSGAAIHNGGRYTPATDSWTAMSTTNAPPGAGSAVWDGDAMLVWGNDGGGRYFAGRPDGDHDGIADTCDACPFDAANDADHDGFCGDVDNCSVVPNVHQLDSDADGSGDFCDTCPGVANPNQADADGDGAGDACDCQPSDPSDRKPVEATSLRLGKSGSIANMSWNAIPDADVYSVTRGDLASKGVNQYGGCLPVLLVSPNFDDTDVPAPGQGYFYLVQGQNFECGPGSLGAASNEQQRINANAGACGAVVTNDAHASGQSTTFGTVVGTLANTQSSNNAYESITEVLSTGGTPSTRFSQLEQRWTLAVGVGTIKQLHVEGYRSSSTDGDDFQFEYSTDGTNFTPLSLTVPLVDDATDRIASLPGSLSGTVTIRVVDTDRTAGHQTLDTVSIDEIWIRAVP